MLGSFKDWTAVYKECFRCLKPGGYLEHVECGTHVLSDDGSLPADSAWADWKRIFSEASEKTGRTFDIIDDDRWVGWMKEAGFGGEGAAEIKTRVVKTPIGAWPAEAKWKEVGLFKKLGLERGLEGFGLYILTSVMGWQYEEVQSWLARVRDVLKNKSIHSYSSW